MFSPLHSILYWVPVAFIVMNFLFVLSHEQVLPPRKAIDGLEASEKIVTNNDFPVSKRDISMEKAEKWHIPSSLSSRSKTNSKFDRQQYSKKRDASSKTPILWHYPTALSKKSNRITKSDRKQSFEKRGDTSTPILWHFPTVGSSNGKTKRVTSMDQKRYQQLSEGQDFSQLKRDTSPEAASKWHFPTASKHPSPFKSLKKRYNVLTKGESPSISSSRATMNKRFLKFLPDTGFCSRSTVSNKRGNSAFARNYAVSSTIRVAGRPWRFVDNIVTRSTDGSRPSKNKKLLNKRSVKSGMSKMRKL